MPKEFIITRKMIEDDEAQTRALGRRAVQTLRLAVDQAFDGIRPINPANPEHSDILDCLAASIPRSLSIPARLLLGDFRHCIECGEPINPGRHRRCKPCRRELITTDKE